MRLRSSAKSERPAPAGVEILVTNDHPRLRLEARRVKAALQLLHGSRQRFETGATALPPAGAAASLSVVFLSDEALAGLHGQFLDDPSPTDVITFPGTPGSGVAGEICVSPEAALRHLAAAPGEPAAAAFSEELTLYLVHGWLHLAGHDDLKPALKRRMRQAEARAMRLLRAAGAMPRFTMKPNRR